MPRSGHPRGPAAATRLLELDRVAPENGGVDSQLFLAASDHYALAQGSSQKPEGLAEGVPGVFLIELGPEERYQRVAAEENP
jgi:hypothetical protein